MGDHVDDLLKSVSSELNAIWKYRKLYNREIAFDFDPIRSFSGVYETLTSSILAYFLTPDESHGQGNTFLKSFLSMLESECTAQGLDGIGDPIFVGCEQCTSGMEGRMDIVLEFESPKRYSIVIENKIHAIDQPKQIDKKYGKAFTIVYLTEDGRLPSNESLTQGDNVSPPSWLCCISWRAHIMRLLDRWIGECRAERVRCFLMDFEIAIRREFGEELDMDESNTVIEKIIATPSSLEAARTIAANWQNAIIKIIDVFNAQMQKQAEENGYVYYKMENPMGKEAGFSLRKNNWKYFIISFCFESNYHGMSACIYLFDDSVTCKTAKFSESDPRIKQAGNEIMDYISKEHQREKYWGSYSIVYFDIKEEFINWDSAEVLSEILDGKNSRLNKHLWETIEYFSGSIDISEKKLKDITFYS